jgi:site-specific recombinase XerD
LKKANINKKGVHILRHTFAKTLVAKNVNLSTIKDLLGHENISTTMIYAKSNESNKIGAVRLL